MDAAQTPGGWRRRRASKGQRAGIGVVFLWFFIGGIFHFAATDTEARIVPPWMPWPVAAVLVSGVFELAGAAGLALPAWRRAAGIGLFLLTIAVTPAHVYMLQEPQRFPVPLWALWLRLPVQALLLWLIAWSTWRPRGPERKG
ncbi:DoxX family protein [uncultured Massilia sp.]|uniref:DoxX family protein n=1 Tax=uncultured Massilia sp. TaxID=169973 RepID=UPI0025F65AFA|nr:DoxX family protein [uncultured Massilia sp.]